MKISSHQAAINAIQTAMTGRAEGAAKAAKSEPISTLKRAEIADLSKLFDKKVGGLLTNPGQVKMMYGVRLKDEGDTGLSPVMRYGIIVSPEKKGPEAPIIVMRYGISPKPPDSK
jgi:hypothetical protein